jgi:GH24 family phage-related lysozyme (muramidase)
MKMKKAYIIAGAAVLLLLLFAIPGGAMAAGAGVDASSIFNVTATFVPEWEGFSATPYWDVSRYSWGYGTAAPGATGTITPAQATSDMNAFLENLFATLQPQVAVSLTANQWAAYLDFAYEEGVVNAENLLTNINSGNTDALQTEWMEYIYEGGVASSQIQARRTAEWQLWNT